MNRIKRKEKNMSDELENINLEELTEAMYQLDDQKARLKFELDITEKEIKKNRNEITKRY